MYAFDYHRPLSVADAAHLLTASEDAKLLAGGHTLLPTMKQRLASPRTVIDLGRVPELRGIVRTGDALVVGAMTTYDELASSSVVGEAIPGLARMAKVIGDPHVRHRGTIGGSIANNDPAADLPAAVLALRATINTSKRPIVADDYFQGLFATALADDEIITRISFPIPSRFAYAKFRNPASRYALVGVAVAERGRDVRVAVTGASASGVFRVPAMEAALTGNWSSRALAGISVDAAGMNSDIHADAAYRAHLVGVLARRAVEEAGR